MSSSGVSEPAPGKPARAQWSLSRKIFAAMGALILVFVGGYVVYGYLNGLPPELVSAGGRGQLYLDAAFMTIYTPSIPGATDFNVTVTVTYANGWHVPFAWGSVGGTSLPVRFVLTPNPEFATGPANGFVFGTGQSGSTTISALGPHEPGAFVSRWSLNYSIREWSAWEGFSQVRWIEVEYELTPVSLDFGFPLPTANVTAPSAADLAPAGIVDNMNLSLQPGILWNVDRDIYNSTGLSTTFHHTLPPVTFEAGDLGNITASLTSSFQWAKGDNYRVMMSFSGTIRGYLTWYWDSRFGSLYTVFAT